MGNAVGEILLDTKVFQLVHCEASADFLFFLSHIGIADKFQSFEIQKT